MIAPILKKGVVNDKELLDPNAEKGIVIDGKEIYLSITGEPDITIALEKKLKELFTEIYKVGISLGGTISGEHGLGYTKKDYLPMAADKGKIDLMKSIKRAFDPNNILNPGKVFDLE
jgi:FAD/FMN-containing dehydrogenase